MPYCPSCNSEVPAGSRFCPACAAPLLPESEAETRTSVPSHAGTEAVPPPTPGSIASFDSLDRSRFIPGTMLAARYRIVGLLGRGGMGEVYRADDLKLGQPVALKFLPAELARDPGRLARLLNEVRLARQVAHPNVCRVYDVGEVDGHHFISMEYVDGENLASLLRQIGHLPKEKAVQISRQVCAGLAAAHEQGILHRDLKPANIMIDGRGRARITDFGLAELTGQGGPSSALSGTPQYMAPEQLTGGGVSVKSDLYSLGLVLYELFTGKRALRGQTMAELRQEHESTSLASPSTLVDAFDPAVERVILRCLERDPSDRPSSALSISAALPGGDPLAAALAAGETPSPEMVAAAGPKGGLKPGVVAACVAVVVLGLLAHAFLVKGLMFYELVPFAKSYEALKDDAREIVGALGHDAPRGDSAAWFQLDQDGIIELGRAKPGEPGTELVKLPGQDYLLLAYRQRAGSMVPMALLGEVSASDPAPASGDVMLQIDLRGALESLYAPPPLVERSAGPPPETDWAALFELARLDIATFEETEPTLQPLLFADTRRAWTGVLPDQADRPVRVEAASNRGTPVFFEKIVASDDAWSGAADDSPDDSGTEDADANLQLMGRFLFGLVVVVLGTLSIGVLLLVARNLKLGRGDRKGALRLALFVVALRLLDWLLTGHHVASSGEIALFVIALAGAIGLGVLVWVLYIALEPYLRRVWPQAIISWSRVLALRFRDPLVGRDVLLGITILIVLNSFVLTIFRIGAARDLVPLLPQIPLSTIRGGRFALGNPFSAVLTSLAIGLAYVIFFALLRMIFRRTSLALVAFCIVYGAYIAFAFTFVGGGDPKTGTIVLALALSAVNTIAIVTVLLRFGLMATMSLFLASGLLNGYPVTANVALPFFTSGLIGPFLIIGLTLYAARLALAGRPLFRDDAAPLPSSSTA